MRRDDRHDDSRRDRRDRDHRYDDRRYHDDHDDRNDHRDRERSGWHDSQGYDRRDDDRRDGGRRDDGRYDGGRRDGDRRYDDRRYVDDGHRISGASNERLDSSPAPQADELSAAEKKRRRLEAARALLGGGQPAAAAPAASPGAALLPGTGLPAAGASGAALPTTALGAWTLPGAPSAGAGAAPPLDSLFDANDDGEARRAEALKEERRRRLHALQLDNELEKQAGAAAAASATSTGPPAAAAAADEDDEDPLDAFMRTNVAAQAEAEAAKAALHAVAWQAQYGHKAVDVDVDRVDEEKDMNLHCYVCKQWGHTKKHCPHKRCKFCGKEGHVADDCKEKDAKIDQQFESDKQRKRAKQYAAKKAKKAEEWEAQLRGKTGVEGFHVLYEILGLPPRKLATKEQIRRAYRLQSLRYHPDKVLPEEVEEAAEKFLAVKTAYDLLLEGMETGGVGMAGAVFSGGDLQYAGWEDGARRAAGEAGREGVPSTSVGDGGGSHSSSHSSSHARGPTPLAQPLAEAEPAEMDGAAQVEALQAMAAARAAANGGQDEDEGEDGVRQGSPVPDVDGQEPRIAWLRDSELRALLADAQVRTAVDAIAANADALHAYTSDAVLMGVLFSLCATHMGEHAVEARGAC
jgi:hypothetical protein